MQLDSEVFCSVMSSDVVSHSERLWMITESDDNLIFDNQNDRLTNREKEAPESRRYL